MNIWVHTLIQIPLGTDGPVCVWVCVFLCLCIIPWVKSDKPKPVPLISRLFMMLDWELNRARE